MTRHELAAASDDLATAAEHVEESDHADRLAELSGQLERLAKADTGPDHGRLARIQSAMHDLREEVDDEAANRIREAHQAINDYREDLEGV